MTIVQLRYLEKILERITPRDEHIEKALAYVNKDLAEYAARKGQLIEQYKFDNTLVDW